VTFCRLSGARALAREPGIQETLPRTLESGSARPAAPE
jgi:hypothetical protein